MQVVAEGVTAAIAQTGTAQRGRCLTLLDLSPLPLSNARPAGVCKDGAAHLGEGVQHAIPLNGGPANMIIHFTQTHNQTACARLMPDCRSLTGWHEEVH